MAIVVPLVAVLWLVLVGPPQRVSHDMNASSPTLPWSFWATSFALVVGAGVAVAVLSRQYRRLSGKADDAGLPSLIAMAAWLGVGEMVPVYQPTTRIIVGAALVQMFVSFLLAQLVVMRGIEDRDVALSTATARSVTAVYRVTLLCCLVAAT